MNFVATSMLITMAINVSLAQITNTSAPEKTTDVLSVSQKTRDFVDVAKVKIHSAKNEFGLEDTIKVNIGTLLTSPEEIYIPTKMRFGVVVMDSRGQRLKIRTIHMDGLVSEMSFDKLKEAYLVDSKTILIGCRSKSLIEEFDRLEKFEQMDSEDPRDAFNVGIFQPIATHCIDAKPGQRLSVYVELFNNTANSRGSEKIRTAIGTVKSNSIEFSVVR